MLKTNTRCSGHYEFYKNGELIGSFDNILTNGYFSRFSDRTSGPYLHLFVGSGNTAPAATDTTLETPLIQSYVGINPSTKQGNEFSPYRYIIGADHVVEYCYSYTWNPGAFTGDVKEVGARFHTATTGLTASSEVDSRALIRDSSNNPTTVSISAADSFTVFFRFRSVYNSTDTAIINIGGTDYTITFEMLGFNYWYHAVDDANFSIDYVRISSAQSLYNNVYSTTGLPTSNKSFTQTWIDGGTYLEQRIELALTVGEMAAGVEYVQMLRYLGGPQYPTKGFHFNPPLTSGSGQTLYITIRYNLGSNQTPVVFSEDFSADFR